MDRIGFPDPLYLYAVLRGDLKMPPGKAAAQAGHAFSDVIWESLISENRDRINAYMSRDTDTIHGAKVVLVAPDLFDLRNIETEAFDLGIPTVLITDSGHVLLPHFTGSPVITALGIGPCTKAEARPFLGDLQLL